MKNEASSHTWVSERSVHHKHVSLACTEVASVGSKEGVCVHVMQRHLLPIQIDTYVDK